MVTLTTLGYGDITPEQPLARFLAYSEAVAGIFYTTILVASLIGVRLAED
jgi:voltage-gated potassium channel